MSQFVLDDHLGVVDVHDQIRRWSTATSLRDIRPGEVIEDERIPSLLQTLRTPTFITIDKCFRDRAFRDRRYCIRCFDFSTGEQRDIPGALRRPLRMPESRTRAVRMGKVARVSHDHVRWWQIGDEVEHAIHWGSRSRRLARR